MITVVCWKWGKLFGPEYVNRLRAMFERHLHAQHRVVCVTDDREGIDGRVDVVDVPRELSSAPRCLRRLRQYDSDWLDSSEMWADRIVSIDLDVVLVDDVTPLFSVDVPLALWYVRHARLYCTSVVMYRPGALQGLWEAFAANPAGYAAESMRAVYPDRRMRFMPQPEPEKAWFDASDQPIVNHYVRTHEGLEVHRWAEGDGIIPYFGEGYRVKAPPMETLPPETRIVALGSSDKAVMDGAKFKWIRDHWHLGAAAFANVALTTADLGLGSLL